MQSYLGMNQTTTSQKKDGSLRKRPAAQSAPKRSGDIWESVEILIENDTAPRVKCLCTATTRSVAARRAFANICAASDPPCLPSQ